MFQFDVDLSIILWSSSKIPVWQGGMDLKYLEDRFLRGKEAVKRILASKHSYSLHGSLNLAHADLVQKQAELGHKAFLDWKLLIAYQAMLQMILI